MAGTKVAPSPDAALDAQALAKGIAKVERGTGYDRILTPDGKTTIAYLKRHGLSIPQRFAPDKLPGESKLESNGRWVSIKLDDPVACRGLLEYVAGKAAA